jgi:signal-transduction protein with cAMP-binding, CBS, and nucleotidyltransferase domain
MISVKDIIDGRPPYFVRDTQTVQQTAEYMAKQAIGAVCVVSENDRLLGIFSERDLLSRVVAAHLDPSKVRISTVMSEVRAHIDINESPHEALSRMQSIGSRHLPVMDGDRWVGMLSIRDLMSEEIREQGDELRFLHQFIAHA